VTKESILPAPSFWLGPFLAQDKGTMTRATPSGPS
jgi:hypothetical protein